MHTRISVGISRRRFATDARCEMLLQLGLIMIQLRTTLPLTLEEESRPVFCPLSRCRVTLLQPERFGRPFAAFPPADSVRGMIYRLHCRDLILSIPSAFSNPYPSAHINGLDVVVVVIGHILNALDSAPLTFTFSSVDRFSGEATGTSSQRAPLLVGSQTASSAPACCCRPTRFRLTYFY